MSKEVNLKDLRNGDYIQHKLGGDKYEVVEVDKWALRIKTPDQDSLSAGFGGLRDLGFVGYRSTPKVERGVVYKKPSRPSVVIFYEPPQNSKDIVNWFSTEDGWLFEHEVSNLLATGEYEALPKE